MILTPRQILDLVLAAGFPPGDPAVMAVAIALAESRGKTDAYNGEVFQKGQAIPERLWPIMGKVCNQAWCGDISYGLWQINMRPDYGAQRRAMWGLSSNEQLFDPSTNARAAFDLYRRRGGSFLDWSTAKYGTYLDFMPQARAAWDSYQGQQAPAPSSPPLPPDPPAGQVPTPAEPGPISQPAATSTPRPKRDLVLLFGQLWRALRLWWSS